MNRANRIIRADVVWARGLRGKGQVVAVVDTGLDTGKRDVHLLHPALGPALAEEPISYRNNGTWDDPLGHGTHVACSAVGRAVPIGPPEVLSVKVAVRESSASNVNSAVVAQREDILGVAHESMLTFQVWDDDLRKYKKGQIAFLFLDAAHRKRHESPFEDHPVRPKKRDGAPLLGFDDLTLDQALAIAEELESLPPPPTSAFPAHVVNMSFHMEYGEYNDNSRWVDRYVWRYRDVVVVPAAANMGMFGDPPIGDFGQAKNAITAGASNNDRSALDPDAMWTKSIRGPGVGGERVKPDLVAPGAAILSARAEAVPGHKFEGTVPHYPEYGVASGTSCAAPIISGAAALVRQFYAEAKGIPSAPASLVKATLINGARRIETKKQGHLKQSLSWKSKLDWRDEFKVKEEGSGWGTKDQGWGLLDLESSLFPAGGRANWFEGESRALFTGDEVEYTFEIEAGQIFKATLVWTDPPYSGHADRYEKDSIIVNRLGLVVVGPDGALFIGNRFDMFRTTSVPIDGLVKPYPWDTFNNVQNVYIDPPKAGVYKVIVVALALPVRTIYVDGPIGMGAAVPISANPSQSYALVVSAKGLAVKSAPAERRASLRFRSGERASGYEGEAFKHEVEVAYRDQAPDRIQLEPHPAWITVTPAGPGRWTLSGTPPGTLDVTLRITVSGGNAQVTQSLELSIQESFL